MPPLMRRPPPSTARPACASVRAALPCCAALRSCAALAGGSALAGCAAFARCAAFAGRRLALLPGVATRHDRVTRFRRARLPAELPELSTQLLHLAVEGVDLGARRQTERADQCFRLLPLLGKERCRSIGELGLQACEVLLMHRVRVGFLGTAHP